MTKDLRRVELHNPVTGHWLSVKMEHLTKGDRFRMFEETGEAVVDPDGTREWVAAGTPYIMDLTGVWAIAIENPNKESQDGN